MYSVFGGYACSVSSAPAPAYRAYKALAALVWGKVVFAPLYDILAGFFSVQGLRSSLGVNPPFELGYFVSVRVQRFPLPFPLEIVTRPGEWGSIAYSPRHIMPGYSSSYSPYKVYLG